MVTATPAQLLLVFVAVRLSQQLAESGLARLNHRHGLDPERQREAASALDVSEEDMHKAGAYATDRYRFGLVRSWLSVGFGLGFLSIGGLSWVDETARALVEQLGAQGPLAVGLAFYAVLGVAGSLLGLPFGLYRTFVIEDKHGFNRQTLGGFFADWLKALAAAALLGGLLLASLLLILERGGQLWWVLAWLAVSGFGVLTAWLYPTLLAPLFNRFIPLQEGELRRRIFDLADRVGFRTSGIYVMDASRRTSHGNAYFTGLFGARRIVLFDTLLEVLGNDEVIAVLAHELGHFKLEHVRRALVRSTLTTGVLLFLMSLLVDWTAAYRAFGLAEPSPHGALLVFGLWFGPLGFLLLPLESSISRRYERAADAFALRHGAPPAQLARALLGLRERSRVLPISHPLYSRVYHSHPPLLERLRALHLAGETPELSPLPAERGPA